MMGDVEALEGILRDIETDVQFVPFVTEIRKLTATYQTGKIRKLLKSLITTESV
jgi:hypothetical protein